MSNEDNEIGNISPNHGSKESTTLSVEVPQANEEDDIAPQINEEEDNNNNNNDEEAEPPLQAGDDERDQLGLNSPKRKSNPPLASNPDEGALTPNTLRYQMNVNSPRMSKGSSGWAAASENDKTQNNKTAGSGLTPADLITQVSRDDPLLSSKQQEQKKLESTSSKSEEKGFFGSCFSCLMCCCSSEIKTNNTNQQIHMTNAVQTPHNNKTYSETPNQKLLEKHNNDQKEKEKEEDDEEEEKKFNKNKQKQQQQQSQLEEEEEQEEEQEESNDTDIESSGLLKQQLPQHKGKKCLVLDLDETLVHSSFKPIASPDFIIPVEIDNVIYRAYVLKRPYVDEFLIECAKNYEVVIFTASVAKYADPLLDQLDPHHTITHRLFRESCVLHGSSYVKDLRKIGRKLKDTIIVDNSPQSYIFQPKNAIPVPTWFDDKTDTDLRDLLPCLNTTLKNIKDVRKILDANEKTYRWLCDQHDKPLSLYK